LQVLANQKEPERRNSLLLGAVASGKDDQEGFGL
jgi:hypothetical protein